MLYRCALTHSDASACAGKKDHIKYFVYLPPCALGVMVYSPSDVCSCCSSSEASVPSLSLLARSLFCFAAMTELEYRGLNESTTPFFSSCRLWVVNGMDSV